MVPSGKIVVVSAPSGAGKSTIVKSLLGLDLGLEFSVSACSRKRRPNEVDGKDYYFYTSDQFKKGIKNNDFIEWEEVYKDQYYGTLRSELIRIWNIGKHVIFDVDVVGGMNIKRQYPEYSLAIFVQPPSLQVLEERLRSRSTDTNEAIATRMSKAEKEMEYASQFDFILTNDSLQRALAEAEEVVRSFLNETV